MNNFINCVSEYRIMKSIKHRKREEKSHNIILKNDYYLEVRYAINSGFARSSLL
jgi:hypothetical protein